MVVVGNAVDTQCLDECVAICVGVRDDAHPAVGSLVQPLERSETELQWIELVGTDHVTVNGAHNMMLRR